MNALSDSSESSAPKKKGRPRKNPRSDESAAPSLSAMLLGQDRAPATLQNDEPPSDTALEDAPVMDPMDTPENYDNEAGYAPQAAAFEDSLGNCLPSEEEALEPGAEGYPNEGMEVLPEGEMGGWSLAPNQVLLTFSWTIMNQLRNLARMEGISPEDLALELVTEGMTRRSLEDQGRGQPSHLMTRTGYVHNQDNDSWGNSWGNGNQSQNRNWNNGNQKYNTYNPNLNSHNYGNSWGNSNGNSNGNSWGNGNQRGNYNAQRDHGNSNGNQRDYGNQSGGNFNSNQQNGNYRPQNQGHPRQNQAQKFNGNNQGGGKPFQNNHNKGNWKPNNHKNHHNNGNNS